MNRAQKWRILSSAFAYRPEETIVDTGCLVNPHTSGSDNHNPHLSKLQKKRKAAAKAAKQARKRNRKKR